MSYALHLCNSNASYGRSWNVAVFQMRNDNGHFSKICIAFEYKSKLSNFGWILLYEFVGTFCPWGFGPKPATIQTIDIICDTCCRWKNKLLKLNLTSWILLHWIGTINRQGNNTVDKSRLKPLNIWIVKLHAFPTFHTSAPNWMKLSGSRSDGLIH